MVNLTGYDPTQTINFYHELIFLNLRYVDLMEFDHQLPKNHLNYFIIIALYDY